MVKIEAFEEEAEEDVYNVFTKKKPIHEQIKAHNCDFCYKYFGKNWILTQHVKSVHEKENKVLLM